MPWVGGHFQAEADRLHVAGIGPHCDQGFTDRFGPPFAEAAIVFGGAAFVGETGDDDLAVALLKKARDLLDFTVLGAVDGLAVEVEVDRLKLIAIDVAAEEGGAAFGALGQWRAGDVIAGRARRLAALFPGAAGGEQGQKKKGEDLPNESGSAVKLDHVAQNSGRSWPCKVGRRSG